ncbi:MAG: hypothetical protein H6603_07035 [Flavobacteriales bacterium]|nr:hypothetical protein [Flavobacteriales bacterium]MCB9191860.1 hypothetical protein [Flavobacteriales bacterium]MCB9204719.1 hypothetical protein [Flavobacteriales bacterium]
MKNLWQYLVLVMLFPAISLAQETDNLPDSLRFTITKDYRPVARDARKILPQPEVKHDTAALKEVDYTVIPKTKELTYEAEPLQAAQLSNEPLAKLYNGFVKAGFGNYTMPFFEASFGSLRSKKYQAGFFARYHASFAKLNKVREFGFTDAGIRGFGKYFMKDHVLKGALEYDVDENYYYGWDLNDVTFDNASAVAKDSLHQVFHHVGLDLDLTAMDKGKKPHILNEAGLRYSYTRGNFQGQEHYAALSTGVAFRIKKETMFIRTAFDYWNLEQASRQTNNLVWGLQPTFRAERERWAIDLGVDFSLDVNDTTTKVLLFPILDFHYFLVKDMLRFYIGAKGGVTRNGLRSISQVNPYFHTDQELSNTWERLNVYAGFKGSIIKGLGFDVSIAEVINGQQMFFVNDTSRGLGHRFITEYHDTRITWLKGAMSYQWKNKLEVVAEAEYRWFVMPTDSIKPWHESPFRFTFSGNYNLKDKFIFKAAISAYGPRVARDFTTDSLGVTSMTPVTLKGYADASIGVEYRYKKWLGAFVDFRNIAALRYDIWKQYQSQRFSFIAGLHFSF